VIQEPREPHDLSQTVLFKDEVYRIQGAIFEVSREMGTGFLEAVYQECLAIEFTRRDVPFVAKPQLALTYKGERLQQVYVPDFICFDCVLVELKSVRELAPEHRGQVFNYLKATGLRLGLLVNFGGGVKARIERVAL